MGNLKTGRSSNVTTHSLCRTVRIIALGACAAVAMLSPMRLHGQVKITASRDYVDKKFAAATNLVHAVEIAVNERQEALLRDKQDALSEEQLRAVNSGVDGEKVAAYDTVVDLLVSDGSDGVVRRSELSGYVKAEDVASIVVDILTNLCGNVYWQSPDEGQTIDAHYRSQDTITEALLRYQAQEE